MGPNNEENEMDNTTKDRHGKEVTQKDVNKAIKHILKLAEEYEVKMDACRFESPEYWENFDKHTNLSVTAESLMVPTYGKMYWISD
jgi:hypothetical protein